MGREKLSEPEKSKLLVKPKLETESTLFLLRFPRQHRKCRKPPPPHVSRALCSAYEDWPARDTSDMVPEMDLQEQIPASYFFTFF